MNDNGNTHGEGGEQQQQPHDEREENDASEHFYSFDAQCFGEGFEEAKAAISRSF